MREQNRFSNAPQWISWINFGLGMWLVITAFLFRHPTGTGIVQNVIGGLFVGLSAVWSARAFRPMIGVAASWTVALAGLWVLAAPFALGYERTDLAVANDVIIGLIVMGLGILNILLKSHQVSS